MQPVENIHYETIVVETGKFVYEGVGGPPIGYCADIFGNQAIILRRTHPDADYDEIRKVGERLHNTRMLRNSRELDRRKGKEV